MSKLFTGVSSGHSLFRASCVQAHVEYQFPSSRPRFTPYCSKINSTRASWQIHSHVFQPSRAKGKSSNFHYKIVLIDDEIVLLGSCNLFAKSILEDSEDLVVLRSRELNHQITLMCKNHKQFPSSPAEAQSRPA